jgi:hypothetical protein
MKKLFIGFFLLATWGSAISQSYPDLKKRLNEFMNFNREMNFEKVLDYSYPKLFTLSPRKDLLAFFDKMYNSDEFSIKLDSMKIDSIFPVFKSGEGLYAKVRYSMLMRMNFKSDSLLIGNGDGGENKIVTAMKSQFGEDKVKSDRENKALDINVVSDMVAAKDRYAKEWCFVNFKEDDKITDALFTKELIIKIASYK